MTPSRKQALLPTGIVLALLGVYYCFFATMIVLDRSGSAGPDEIMRLLVPKAMLRGNLLPSGYDSDTILAWGNWSYAFYPQMLGAYVTSVFMGVARLFGAGPIAQLYAARLLPS